MPASKLAEVTDITISSNTTEVITERDEFCGDEYVDPYARLPRITALRGEDASQCGYFVTVPDMAKCGWKNFDETQLITYTYNSGGKEQGILIKEPRMLVVERSPLLALDKKAQNEKKTIFYKYSKEEHSDRELFAVAQVYEIILLDEFNQPLHEIGLLYIPKGANRASFQAEWQKFIVEITSCHAIANGIPAKPKDARFKALCVFELQIKREMAGEKAKSPAIKVIGFTSPTMETWTQFFLGRTPGAKDIIWSALVPEKPLSLPNPATLALPMGEDLSE